MNHQLSKGMGDEVDDALHFNPCNRYDDREEFILHVIRVKPSHL